MITRALRLYRLSVLAQCQLARERQHLDHAASMLKAGRPERARASEAALGLADIRTQALWPESKQALEGWGQGFFTWPSIYDHGDRLEWLTQINHRGHFPFTQGLDPAWEQHLLKEQNHDIEVVCALGPQVAHAAQPLSPHYPDVPVTRFAQSLLSALAHVPSPKTSQAFETRPHLKITGCDLEQLQVFAQLARKTWSVMLKHHVQQDNPKAQQLLVLLELSPSMEPAASQNPNQTLSHLSSKPLNQTPWDTLKHLESATWDAMDALTTLDGYADQDEASDFEGE